MVRPYNKIFKNSFKKIQGHQQLLSGILGDGGPAGGGRCNDPQRHPGDIRQVILIK